MDEKELLKVGVESALKPFANLLERLFGGSVDEIGGMWQASFRARRIVRQAKLFAKVQEELKRMGVEPQRVPDKISIPILQATSVEDDEYLQDRWAALLANAANPATAESIQASFPDILRQLTRNDAVFLDAIYEYVRTQGRTPRLHQPEAPPDPLEVESLEIGCDVTMLSIFADAGLASSPWRELLQNMGKPLSASAARELTGFRVALLTLRRLQLVSTRLEIKTGATWESIGEVDQEEKFYLTVLGCEFVRACSPATPGSQPKPHAE
ncbi:MAG TPA: Abi-alpha family protein [Bryobacteraceae bacterium]|nr:Abi-alpha family protein [Bryobacteraceae bacterium]HPT29175.1 Abi-alpha family protein [Bryobacteraceae bacterium]